MTDYLDEIITEGGLRQEAKFWREKFERVEVAKPLLQHIWSQIEAAEFEDIENDDDLVVITILAPQAREIHIFLENR